MDFRESLSHAGFAWEKAYALALASKLAYREDPVIEHVVTRTWGFEQCRLIHVGGARAFVAWDQTLLLVAFRGTAGLSDWKVDAEFPLEPRHQFSLHRGFYNAFKRIQTILEPQIDALENQPRHCFFTGHSLGGAVGSIAAGYLWKKFWDKFGERCVEIYTFGQPCPGDERFKNYCAQVFPEKSVRFVNEDDLVTKLPPAPFGYQQVEKGVYFDLPRAGSEAQLLSEEEYGRRFAEVATTFRLLEGYDGEAPLQGDSRTWLGISEHFIDAYIRKIGLQITKDAREGLEGDQSQRLRPEDISTPNKVPSSTAAVPPINDATVSARVASKQIPALTQSLEKPVTTSSAKPAMASPEPVEFVKERVNPVLHQDPSRLPHTPAPGNVALAEQLPNPVQVHVLWSKRRKDDLCWRAAESIFHLLSHVPTGQPDLSSGAGIPVFTGYHFQRVEETIEEFLSEEADPFERPCLVVVVLLEQEARVDPEFHEFWERISERNRVKGYWPRVLLLPVALDRSWEGEQNDQDGSFLVFSRSAQYISEPLDKPDTTENKEKWHKFKEEWDKLVRKKAKAVSWDIGVEICHFLADRIHRTEQIYNPNVRQRVRIFISHTKSDLKTTDNLAQRLRDHINSCKLRSFFDANDVAVGRPLADQLSQAQEDAICLSLRTDNYSESPYCLREILTAKKQRVPIVTVSAVREAERRSLTYGGNSVVLAYDSSADDLDRIATECLKARLRDLHFQVAAPVIVARRSLRQKPAVLSRAPELLDFAFSGDSLPTEAGTLVFYPDPPLPLAESNLLRRAYPKIKLATPTTVSEGILRRDPAPTLNGIRVAMSLSEGAELARDFKEIGPDRQASIEKGLIKAHLDQIIAYLTLCLIRAGAELGYGGHLEGSGYTAMLSFIIGAHKRTQGSARDFLHSYLASYIWNLKPPSSDAIDANFIHIERRENAAANAITRNALELSKMRRVMASDEAAAQLPFPQRACNARVILGGKSLPKRSPKPEVNDPGYPGYSGRFPGQAEEAWYHLRENIEGQPPRPVKPLYVIGGYYGSAQDVATALQGPSPEFEELLKTSQEEERNNKEFAQLIEDYDKLRRAEDRSPRNLTQLWNDIAELGRGAFYEVKGNGDGSWPDHDSKWPDNGLSREENLSLFRATDPDAISALVMKGLNQAVRKVCPQKLRISLFNGSITDVMDVDGYGIMVLKGAALRGADGALDDRLEGGLSRFLERHNSDSSGRPPALHVRHERLVGDWVLTEVIGSLHELDSSASPEKQKEWLTGAVQRGIVQLVDRADQQGLLSLAIVPTGGSLGLTPEESVEAALRGLLQAKQSSPTSTLDCVALCELDPRRYEQIAAFLGCRKSTATTADSSGGPVPVANSQLLAAFSIEELQPDAPREVREQVFLTLREREGDMESILMASAYRAAHGVDQHAVNWSALRETLSSRTATPPAPHQHEEIGQYLAQQLLSESAQDILAGYTAKPPAGEGLHLEIFHDRSCSLLPIELMCLRDSRGRMFFPALESGLSRILLVEGLSHSRHYQRLGVKLKLLLIVNPKGDLPAAEAEGQLIQDALRDCGQIEVDLLWGCADSNPDPATRASKNVVLEHLSRTAYDLIHYAGHGSYEGGKSSLIFKDGTFVVEDLQGQMMRPPALVFLNACEAGRNSPDYSANLADTILRGGVRGFLGALWKVADSSAAEFASSVYNDLGNGCTLGEAVLSARKRLFEKGNRHWANYVFYGSPDIRL